ncbi:MAG: hypothetical protein SGI92_25635 [Bryobacteraceae bacterium]|nr:hypothetical protein [Bryobacteraceae bacterium]
MQASTLPRIQRREEASASILNVGAGQLALSSTARAQTTAACAIETSGGTQGFIGGGGQQAEPPPTFGDKIRLDGPAGSWDLTLPPPHPWYGSTTYTTNVPVADPVQYFDQLPASVWTPGKYTFSGAAGDSLQPFRIETEIPGPIRLRNPESLRTIDRSRDLTLDWDTAWIRPDDVINIGLISLTETTPIFLTCSVRALDGTLTIPSSLLQQHPAAEVNGQRSPMLSFGYLRPRTNLQLPRRNADPVPAFVDWSSYAIIPVALR